MSNEEMGPVNVRLIDMSGRMITTFNGNKNTDNQEFKMDLNQLNPGLYLLEISQGENKTVKRIIKE